MPAPLRGSAYTPSFHARDKWVKEGASSPSSAGSVLRSRLRRDPLERLLLLQVELGELFRSQGFGGHIAESALSRRVTMRISMSLRRDTARRGRWNMDLHLAGVVRAVLSRNASFISASGCLLHFVSSCPWTNCSSNHPSSPCSHAPRRVADSPSRDPPTRAPP